MSEHTSKDFLSLLTASGVGKLRGGKTNAAHALTDSKRLETAAFECLVSGLSDERVVSLLHMLQWPDSFKCFCVTGVPKSSMATAQTTIRRKVYDLGGKQCLIGQHDGMCVALIAVQSGATPEVTCTAIIDAFTAESPVCLGPQRSGVKGARQSIAAALATVRTAPAVRPLPRPLRAEDVLPERALLGDEDALEELYTVVYSSIKGAGTDDYSTLDTIEAFLKYGGSLDNASRELNVHPNTVRYRIKRAAETTGWNANDPRDAFVMHTAITLGRIQDARQ